MSERSILLIDDDANIRRTLALILQRAGYQVSTARQACEAISYLETHHVDLVFLDLKMPDVDGMSLLPKIHFLYAKMPVLVLTAQPTPEAEAEARQLGAVSYLTKPVDPESLLKTVQEILGETPTLQN